MRATRVGVGAELVSPPFLALLGEVRELMGVAGWELKE